MSKDMGVLASKVSSRSSIPRRVIINYDNGQSWKTGLLRHTNAVTVGKGENLVYEEKEPMEISPGLLQRAEFAIDMVDVSSLDIFLSNGELITRKFRKRA